MRKEMYMRSLAGTRCSFFGWYSMFGISRSVVHHQADTLLFDTVLAIHMYTSRIWSQQQKQCLHLKATASKGMRACLLPEFAFPTHYVSVPFRWHQKLLTSSQRQCTNRAAPAPLNIPKKQSRKKKSTTAKNKLRRESWGLHCCKALNSNRHASAKNSGFEKGKKKAIAGFSVSWEPFKTHAALLRNFFSN
jgi:hypothetical protein